MVEAGGQHVQLARAEADAERGGGVHGGHVQAGGGDVLETGGERGPGERDGGGARRGVRESGKNEG